MWDGGSVENVAVRSALVIVPAFRPGYGEREGGDDGMVVMVVGEGVVEDEEEEVEESVGEIDELCVSLVGGLNPASK